VPGAGGCNGGGPAFGDSHTEASASKTVTSSTLLEKMSLLNSAYML
jgi:hypothetical protein